MIWIQPVYLATSLFAVLWGCAISPPPIPLHDEPTLRVALEYDPHAGAGHSHPAPVSTDTMIAVLHGLHLQGRDVVGTFGLLGNDPGTAAFTNREILAGVASHLVIGLAKASPRDLVTFYVVQRDSQHAPLITSGGVFVRGHHLYVILANGRTSPSAIQYETTYEPNTRHAPLVPIARFKFKASFQPPDSRVTTSEAKQADRWEGYLDESKVVVIDLLRLPNALPPSTTTTPAVPPSTP